ncbi:MAG: hypothetical protein MUE63_00145 [Xanthomonadales bacterium]|nr:hypothetical protein [Xanthomonadales bacterium]
MSKKETAAETPVDDEYAGQGGRYVVNPMTGRRELVSRTLPADYQPMKDEENGTPQA